MRKTLWIIVLLTMAGTVLAAAEDTAPTDEPATTTPAPDDLPPAVATDFDERLQLIQAIRRDAERIDRQTEAGQTLKARVVSTRLTLVQREWFTTTIDLAQDIAAQMKDGRDVDHYRDEVLRELQRVPDVGEGIIERLRSQLALPTGDAAASDWVVADQKLLQISDKQDRVYEAFLIYIEIAEVFGLDQAAMRSTMEEELSDSAANRSVFLQMSLDEVVTLKGAVSTMPSDGTLVARLSAAQARVGVASRSLQSAVNLMNRLGLETRQYRKQLLTATGELTADVLDVGIVAGLFRDWSEAVIIYTTKEGPRILFRVLLVILVLVLFAYLSILVKKALARAMKSSRVTLSHLLKDMIVATARNLVFFIGILFALSQLGISLGPLLAGLGIAGFIVGFALQDTLSNFASGLMILVYRPFDVGDFVNAGGVQGKVDRMSLVNTTFKTLDNQVIVVPNNMIWQQVITNLTAQRTRRVDLTFGISYGDDIDKAKAILKEVVDKHDAVLKTPEPNIRVGALGASSVDLICRPWVRTDDYWDTYWDLTETVKKRFDEEGITIPFPQQDVHLHEVKPA